MHTAVYALNLLHYPPRRLGDNPIEVDLEPEPYHLGLPEADAGQQHTNTTIVVAAIAPANTARDDAAGRQSLQGLGHELWH